MQETDPLAPRPDAIETIASDLSAEFRTLNFQTIAITLGLLSLFLLGHFIPLYGMNVQAVAEMERLGSTIDRVSLMTLGVIPWASAVVIIETVGLLIAPLRASLGFKDGHCDPFHWFVIVITLVLSSSQAYNIGIALDVGDLTSHSSWLSSLALIVSAVAGTIFAVVIARLINLYGTGHGFWFVFGFSVPFAFPKALETLLEMSRTGTVDLLPSLLIEIGVLIAIAIITIILTRALFHKGITSPAPLVFPLMISGHIASYAVAFAYYLTQNMLSASYATFLMISVSCVITALLLIVYLRKIFDWKILAFATVALCMFQILPSMLAELGLFFGWYWQTSAGQTLAFFASLTFIVSGVYGRLSVRGNP